LRDTGHFEEILLHEIGYTCCENPHPQLNDIKIADGTADCYYLDLINARCAWSITSGVVSAGYQHETSVEVVLGSQLEIK
jgi:hypothetical protein